MAEFYNEFYLRALSGQTNLSNGGDTLKMILVSGYTPDIDNHSVYADVSGDEMSGTGYTAGGEEVSGQTVTKDNTNNKGTFDAINVTWAGLDIGTPSHAILRNTTHDHLICYWEVTLLSEGLNYCLEFDSEGIIDLSS